MWAEKYFSLANNNNNNNIFVLYKALSSHNNYFSLCVSVSSIQRWADFFSYCRLVFFLQNQVAGTVAHFAIPYLTFSLFSLFAVSLEFGASFTLRTGTLIFSRWPFIWYSNVSTTTSFRLLQVLNHFTEE